ncbi:MAG TPA: hypothetical protein PK405_03270 [Hyphomicrobiales bacterium]|nr:hypothetical protein [Hyphomicrobiales bacterium]
MSAMISESRIEKLISDLVKSRLDGVKILKVSVERSLDYEDDSVLDVTIIFEAKSDLDAAKVASMVRHLRPKLKEAGEAAFPLMSFVSKNDARKLGFEAA